MSSAVQANVVSVTTLRQELKAWERAFADVHAGRKPSRDDIKNDGEIARKYKEFNRLTRPQTYLKPVTTPRKSANAPQKRRDVLEEKSVNITVSTPRKSKAQNGKCHEQHEVAVVEEPTPAFIRCALGPTPQKDGQVLGLFDMFHAETPSRSATLNNKAEPATAATPSKQCRSMCPEAAFLRTPQSSGKRFYLDNFAGTPLKRKREDDDMGTPDTAKRGFATPSFLRRSWKLGSIQEGDEDEAPVTRKPLGVRKGLVRSLSTIVAGLRKQEDDRMDDEWETMKEIEAEQRGGSRPATEPAAVPVVEVVQVEDSQVPDMPLGPDQLDLSEDEEQAEQGGTRKPWKKKGLKRQTKRSNMKPILHAPQKAKELESTAASDHEASENEGNLEAEGGKKGVKEDGNAGTKKTKNLNGLAHMNFRRLKIKNKNSKANGRGGRFGRR